MSSSDGSFLPIPSSPRRRGPSVFDSDPSSPRTRGPSFFPPLAPSPSRRAVLAALLASASLAACGFQLRGHASYAFRSVYVNAPAHAPFAADLRRALAGAGTATVTDTAAAAEVVVEIIDIADDKQVLSLSPGGRVQEYALAKVVRFRVLDREGREWLRTDEIVVRRTYTYDDTERLAREIQEQRLFRDMQADAAQQIVRRLQVARAPA